MAVKAKCGGHCDGAETACVVILRATCKGGGTLNLKGVPKESTPVVFSNHKQK
jgi:hypothetical protein